MTEYAIITILSLALAFTFWRSRVWKRRAAGKGFWGVIERQMVRNLETGAAKQEWPEVLTRNE